MYAAINSISTVQAVISTLASTAAGMNFLFLSLFLLVGLVGVFVLIADIMGVVQDIELASNTCMALVPLPKPKLTNMQQRVMRSLANPAYALWEQEVKAWQPSKRYSFEEVLEMLNSGISARDIELYLDERERYNTFGI